jgi:hypothetical protein
MLSGRPTPKANASYQGDGDEVAELRGATSTLLGDGHLLSRRSDGGAAGRCCWLRRHTCIALRSLHSKVLTLYVRSLARIRRRPRIARSLA